MREANRELTVAGFFFLAACLWWIASDREDAQPPLPDRSQAALRDHNAERARAGIRPLLYDESLERGAQSHARRISRRGYLVHESGPFAENIAHGYPDLEAVMRGWMASRGHRANILNPQYTRFGFGFALGEAGDSYWCTRFQ